MSNQVVNISALHELRDRGISRRYIETPEWAPVDGVYVRAMTARERTHYSARASVNAKDNTNEAEAVAVVSDMLLDAVLMCTVDESGQSILDEETLNGLCSIADDPVGRLFRAICDLSNIKLGIEDEESAPEGKARSPRRKSGSSAT